MAETKSELIEALRKAFAEGRVYVLPAAGASSLLDVLFASCRQLNATESHPLYRMDLEIGPSDGRVWLVLKRGGASVGVRQEVAPTSTAIADAARSLVEHEIKEAGKR